MEGVHLSFLCGVTIAVILLALGLAIWLGLYLVSLRPRYMVAWLPAQTLWFKGGTFLNGLQAINSTLTVPSKYSERVVRRMIQTPPIRRDIKQPC